MSEMVNDWYLSGVCGLTGCRLVGLCTAERGDIGEKIADPRTLEGAEGERPAEIHGGDADSRRQQAVDHAFAETLGEPGCHAVAEYLLGKPVADRDGAGDGEMSDDVAQ